MPAIHDIPNEVLFHIFTVGCNQQPDKFLVRNVKRRLNPFILPVLSVCSGWRSLCSAGKIHDCFFVTCAFLRWAEDSDPYDFILELAAYRATLLSSNRSTLFVTVHLYHIPRDRDTLRLQIHAIDMAFQHREQLRGIYLTIRHLELMKCLAYNIFESSSSQSFSWIARLDDWEPFTSSPNVDPIFNAPFASWTTSNSEKQPMNIWGFSDGSGCNRFRQIDCVSTWASIDLRKLGRFLFKCHNLTRLIIKGYDVPPIQDDESEQQITLALVKTLNLRFITAEVVARIFTGLVFPRLAHLTAEDINPLYPFRSIELPASLVSIDCHFRILDHMRRRFIF